MDIIGQKNHKFYLLSNGISILGDMIGLMSISWWVIQETESSTVMATIMAPSIIARIFGGPLFGVFADFFSRQKIVIFSDGVSALMWIGLFFYYSLGLFNPLFLSSFFFIMSLLRAMLKSAAGGMLVDLGSVEVLIKNIQSSSSVARIFGAAGGAVFLEYLGLEAAFIFNSISFLFASYLVTKIKIKENIDYKVDNNKISFHLKFYEGLKYIKEYPSLIRITLYMVVFQFCVAGFPVLLPSFVKLGKGFPGWYLGLLELALGFGILVGTLVIIPFVKRNFSDYSLEISSALMSLGFSFLFFGDIFILPILGILFIQAGFVSSFVPLNSRAILDLPVHLRSRVSSIIGSCIDASALGGLMISSIGFSYLGYKNLFSLMAIFYFVFFIFLILAKQYDYFQTKEIRNKL